MTQKISVAYIPVLHKGYFDFLNLLVTRGVTELYVVGDEILLSHEELDYIHRKDRLRALPHDLVVRLISQGTTLQVKTLDLEKANELRKRDVECVMPNEDISKFIAEKYLDNQKIEYVDVFLRWNKENIGEEKDPIEDTTISLSEFQRTVLQDVVEEGEKSFDWWRQVGAALVKDGKVVAIAHNEHMPEAELPNILGDTRALFKKGININYVTSAHAEASVIGEAAKRGVNTENAELYVTDFPCPYCARLIAKSGIKKVYFMKGYAVLDGDEFFKDEGIEIARVIL